MQTKRKSGKSSLNSNTRTSRRPKRSGQVTRDIISGLQEGAAFFRGDISLPVRLVNVPDRSM